MREQLVQLLIYFFSKKDITNGSLNASGKWKRVYNVVHKKSACQLFFRVNIVSSFTDSVPIFHRSCSDIYLDEHRNVGL